jgi:SET domain-containing protein
MVIIIRLTMALLEKQLVVKKSTLPGVGKGLFTKKIIPKGTRIVEYKGRIAPWKELSGKNFNRYIFYVKRDHVINASPYKKAVARFANDAKGLTKVKGIANNSSYEQEGLQIFITATKDIAAGNEILVDYGKEYWNVVRYNTRVDRKKIKRNRP